MFPDRHFWLVGRPEVGQSMALLTEDGDHSIVTSPIERMVVADNDAIYVETRGSVYQLARAEV